MACDVTGLSNGTTYTFRVQALNNVGWGDFTAPSNAVIPTAPEPEPVTITLTAGQRVKEGRRDRVTATGSVSGRPPGSRLVPFVRVGASGDFSQGLAPIALSADGTFRWSRSVGRGKAVSLYVEAGGQRSETVSWPPLRKGR